MTTASFRWADLPPELQGCVFDELVLSTILPEAKRLPLTRDGITWLHTCRSLVESSPTMAKNLLRHFWAKEARLWTSEGQLPPEFKTSTRADQLLATVRVHLISDLESQLPRSHRSLMSAENRQRLEKQPKTPWREGFSKPLMEMCEQCLRSYGDGSVSEGNAELESIATFVGALDCWHWIFGFAPSLMPDEMLAGASVRELLDFKVW